MVDVMWCGDHQEDRSARFINDRVHANIQRDGTFSVVPRIRGGVTSPNELRRIADVAEKYNVKMVKITGSQRIDLLGIRKSDLPKVWADLGMPSGQAYTKGVRMVKTCVGTEFCRFGTQDAIGTGVELERRLENLYTPHKTKMGVVGCPRNCAEATVKDIGLVGQEGSWQVVVGGAAGKHVRKADLLITVQTSRSSDALLPVLPRERQLPRAHLRLRRAVRHREGPQSNRLRQEGREEGAAVAPAEIENTIEGRVAGEGRARTPHAIRANSAHGGGARMRWIRVNKADNFPLREGRCVTIEGEDVAVFNLGDRFLAVDNACPHRGGPLCDGIVSGETVVCPLHNYKISLQTGEVLKPDVPVRVQTYETRVENGVLMIAVAVEQEVAA